MCEKIQSNRPTCKRCGSGNVVVRKDLSVLCRRCGADSRVVDSEGKIHA